MSLNLDSRARAMLAEIGVRIFEAPLSLPVSPPAPVSKTPSAPAPPQVVLRERPVHSDAGWDDLEQRGPVFGLGDRDADWFIAGDPPEEAELREGRPFAADAGVLLDNMLKAVGLVRGQAYLAHLAKTADGQALMRRQVELVKPKVIVVVGRSVMTWMLDTDEPLGRLRGRAHEFAGVPVVVTYPPSYLLRSQADKGKAWADLCLAMDLARDQASGRRANGE